MSNIRIDLPTPISNGQSVTFKSPADCSEVEGLKVYYPVQGGTKSTTFQFADAHGNNVGGINLFAENVIVKVILDTVLLRAYVQNADTNAYLEGRLSSLGIESPDHPGCFYRVVNGVVEWINPPMLEGVEYRTTERHLGDPVYIKLLSMEVPEANQSTEVVVASHADDLGLWVISFDGYIYDHTEANDFNHFWKKLPLDDSTGICSVSTKVIPNGNSYDLMLTLRNTESIHISSQCMDAWVIIKYSKESVSTLRRGV